MTNKKPSTEKKQLKEDMKQLTIARLRSIPDDYQISIGSAGTLTREQAIENVEQENELGKELIEVQLEFLRDMARGELYKYE